MSPLSRSARAAVAVAILAGCGTTPAPHHHEVAPAPTPPQQPSLDRAKLTYASMLARGRPIADDEWSRWTDQHRSPAAIVDELLQDPFLGRGVAPPLLFKHYLDRSPSYTLMLPYQLKATGDIYHLRKPCNKRRSELVAPWWDLAHPIRICSDSIRANVWDTQRPDGSTIACSAWLAAPSENPVSACGCGPNLVRCFPKEIRPAFMAKVKQEVRDTIADAIANDRPLAQLFVGDATVRTRESELVYLKANAEGLRMTDPATLLATADSWPQEPTLAPRAAIEEGQHAGLMTSPQITYSTGDLRQRMRTIFELMWCAEISAPGALPEHLLELKTAELRNASDELSARPICTNCHARLDSAMQFFATLPSPASDAWHTVHGSFTGKQGPLFGNDIRDRRGVAPLNAQGFARLALRQPEFARCMTRNAVEYVFGTASSPDMIDRLAAAVAPDTVTFRDLVRSALLEFIACASCRPPAMSQSVPIASDRPRATLAELIDEHCAQCHFDGADIPGLEGKLRPDRVIRAVDQVLYGRMPPGGGLPVARRLSFLDATARAMPTNPWTKTRSFLVGHADPPPALPLFVAREYAHQVVTPDSHPDPMNAVENAVDGRDMWFTPSYTTETAIEAYRACAAAAGSRADCADAVLDGIWDLSSPPW